MTYFLRYLAAENNSPEIKVTFGGLGWPAKIEWLWVAMIWPLKIEHCLAVISVEADKNFKTTENYLDLVSAACA
jgi:hypothetical protein